MTGLRENQTNFQGLHDCKDYFPTHANLKRFMKMIYIFNVFKFNMLNGLDDLNNSK